MSILITETPDTALVERTLYVFLISVIEPWTKVHCADSDEARAAAKEIAKTMRAKLRELQPKDSAPTA